MKSNLLTAMIGLIFVVSASPAETPKVVKDTYGEVQPAAAAALTVGAATIAELEAAVAENPLKEAYFGETHVHTSVHASLRTWPTVSHKGRT
jgi:hypothetical protein